MIACFLFNTYILIILLIKEFQNECEVVKEIRMKLDAYFIVPSSGLILWNNRIVARKKAKVFPIIKTLNQLTH